MQGAQTFLYVVAAILIGTGLILLLMKLRKIKIWKMMFFFAVWMTCSITLGVFIDPNIALVAGFLLAALKLYKPNTLTHNITELMIYAGIAVIFVPLLDIFWITALLLVISAYDVFAVWKSKHMISMAEFQTKSKAFAGFVISYKAGAQRKTARGKETGKKEEYKNAVLGGGDIAFPMIFTGVVMDALIKSGVAKPLAFLNVIIITAVITLALLMLLAKARKDRFYPAMPFLTAGCLIGYSVLVLLI